MKKGLFILLISCALVKANAQTGIGTSTPNASAKLDVYATDKGFLPPRITLTATNSASPITSPANGLMVFNTVTAGSSPFQVVPGYYYWDGTGQQWVSLSTTVGNVQNQAIFRSTASNTNGTAVSTWNARFNNIASGDLTVSSNTTFALSNGIYKIQWGLPHQSTQTYNMMQLQENISGTWTPWRSEANLANVANGGNTDWGGTSFMTDVVDCSSSTKTLRLINADGSRALLLGASFIITKLNSDITTSTTADNLGNHKATKNLLLNGYYISNDGGDEGIKIDNAGNIGIGNTIPAIRLHVKSNGQTFRLEGIDHVYMELFPQGATTRHAYFGYPSANSTQLSLVNERADGTLGFGTNSTIKMVLNSVGKLGLGTSVPGTAIHIENGNTFGTDPSNTTSPSLYVFNNNNASSSAHATAMIRTAGAASGKPYLGFDISGVSGYSIGINNPTDQLIFNTTWNFSTGTAANNAIILNRTGNSRVVIPSSAGGYTNDWPSGWGGGISSYDISASGIYYNVLVQRSDRRLKNTIDEFGQDVIAKYLQLRPIKYFWNQGKSSDTNLQYGLIAQEVETLFPEMVLTASDSMQTKSVNYQALHALSLKVIQSQQAEIELLKTKQLEFEARLLKLEAKLNQ